jgi:hypothetical protein
LCTLETNDTYTGEYCSFTESCSDGQFIKYDPNQIGVYTCESCVSDCKICNNYETCFDCDAGFYKTFNGLCVSECDTMFNFIVLTPE